MEITTGVYDRPYVTRGIYEDGPARLYIKWVQRHEGDERDSFYEISLDKDTGVANVRRTGEIRSELCFDTSRDTKGIIDTPYGTISTDIKTYYINMPSALDPRLMISYKTGDEKNVFAVKLNLRP